MLARALSLLAPPLCGVCREPCAPEDPICRTCSRAIARPGAIPVPIAGVDRALAACPYDGIPRRLVASLKFASRLPLAHAAASAIAAAAADLLRDATVVPVPPSPNRSRRRGFDSAAEIARALSSLNLLELRACLARSSGPRQVGRSRAARLADPPRVSLKRGPAPTRAVLVDDVITTGATLSACAAALRAGGCRAVGAVAFAHST